MMRDECEKDARSPEAEKITPIQATTGSQYLMNESNLSTAHGNRVPEIEATVIIIRVRATAILNEVGRQIHQET